MIHGVQWRPESGWRIPFEFSFRNTIFRKVLVFYWFYKWKCERDLSENWFFSAEFILCHRYCCCFSRSIFDLSPNIGSFVQRNILVWVFVVVVETIPVGEKSLNLDINTLMRCAQDDDLKISLMDFVLFCFVCWFSFERVRKLSAYMFIHSHTRTRCLYTVHDDITQPRCEIRQRNSDLHHQHMCDACVCLYWLHSIYG